MIDLHFHILPGIDDGPSTLDDALALAKQAAATGTTTIAATPHVSWEHQTSADTVADGVAALQAELDSRDISLTLVTGGEVACTRALDLPNEDLERHTLNGGRWLLLEPPFVPSSAGVEQVVSSLRNRGFEILLAHPERSQAFHADPQLLAHLVSDRILCSLTAGSLVGRFGQTVRRFSEKLFAEGLVHNVASDAHDLYRRPPGIAAELEQAGYGALTTWLTEEVPRAILEGERPPPRPEVELVRPKGRWLGRLARRS